MAAQSAGIMMYNHLGGELRVLLVHPGGPFWRNKDEGAWSIPKGEYGPDEGPEAAARREFAEELGLEADGALQPLGEIRQRGGKRVTAFALEGDLDVDAIRSNEFQLEWPPGSGRVQTYPEVDRAAWLSLPAAAGKLLASQLPFLDRLAALCGASS
jgi:predicted NUDIX family NTP pyrophosphohydrolase